MMTFCHKIPYVKTKMALLVTEPSLLAEKHPSLTIVCVLISTGVPCSPSSFQEDNGCPLSKQMMTYFANFMRNGDPNSPATSHIWPLYRASSSAKQTKLLSVRHSSFLRVTKNYKQDEINLWNRYLYSESLKDTTEYQDCSGVDQCEEKVKLPPPADVTDEANEAPLPKDEL